MQAISKIKPNSLQIKFYYKAISPSRAIFRGFLRFLVRIFRDFSGFLC